MRRAKINLTINHSVLVKGAAILSAVLKSEDASSLLVVLYPITLILRAIGIVKGTFAVTEALLPVADVAVPEQFVVASGVKPNMSSKALLIVVNPLTSVLFICGDPVHDTLAVALVVFPISLVVVA